MGPDEEARFIRRYRLGLVVEASAHMETVLRTFFGALLGTPRANVIAAGQSVSWLVANTLAMIDNNDKVRAPSLGDPDDVARFRAAIAKCGELNTRRNGLIHGAWVDGLPDGRPGTSQLHSKRRQPWPSAKEVRLEDIEQLADDVFSAVGELVEAANPNRSRRRVS